MPPWGSAGHSTGYAVAAREHLVARVIPSILAISGHPSGFIQDGFVP
jgi:hypothetical protein